MKQINASYNHVTNCFTDCSEGIRTWENEKIAVLLQGHVMLDRIRDDLQQAADCFCENGCRMTEMLQGLYLLVIFDKVRERVTVLQDRFTSPVTLYYTIADDTVYFSTSLKTLLKTSKIPRSFSDESVLEDFIANGYIYGRETLVKQVYKLEPFHALVVENHRVEQIAVQYAASEMTQGQALDRFKAALDQAIISSTDESEEVSLPLSGGYDSSYIAHVISTQTGKKIRAFSVGGQSGKNELPVVEKNLTFFPGAVLNTALTDSETLKHLPEIVERLEGSVFEVGIFLQYELMKKAVEGGKTALICGECADQVFNPYFYDSERIFPHNEGVMQFDFSEYPYIFGTQLILKKSGIMANSFGIETFYPYLNDDVVRIAEPLGLLNGKDKRCHVANCRACFPAELLENITKIGGATECCSLFESEKEIQKFFKCIESEAFYRKHEGMIKRCSLSEREKQSKADAVKTWGRNAVLSLLHIGNKSRKENKRFLTEMKIREYLCVAYLIEFERLFIQNEASC